MLTEHVHVGGRDVLGPGYPLQVRDGGAGGDRQVRVEEDVFVFVPGVRERQLCARRCGCRCWVSQLQLGEAYNVSPVPQMLMRASSAGPVHPSMSPDPVIMASAKRRRSKMWSTLADPISFSPGME